MKKQRLGAKLADVWARGASNKILDPLLLLQPLKLTTSNLVHNLGLKSSLPKTTFRTKIGGGFG